MLAVVVRSPGGPEALTPEDRSSPEPGPGEVRVAVAAAGVNFIDVYQRTGAYPLPTPFVAGSEGAGRVTAVGPGVESVAVGDVVAWAMVNGAGYAQEVVVPAERVVPVPAGVGAETAAAVMLQGMTAHYLTASTYPVQPGDVALVHAAAGGVGLLLTQLVVRRGGRVIATVSSEEKAALAREAGAADVVRYDEQDVAAQVRALTGGDGVAVVYDGVGRATFEGSIDSLRRRGMMVLYGAASGPVAPVDPQLLNAKGSLFLTRPTLAHYTADRDELLQRSGDLFAWIEAGELDVRIGGRYPLADAGRAHEDLEARRTTGKLLLLPG